MIPERTSFEANLLKSTLIFLATWKKKAFAWKKKAIDRGQELRVLRKKIKVLIASRAKWKEKHKAAVAKIAMLTAVNKALEKQAANPGTRVKNYSYCLETISFCLSLRNTGQISLRNCVEVLKLLTETFDFSLGIPCINSIRNWENKYGLHKLERTCENEDDYMVIIDESFCIAKQTILLILGVNLSTYDFNKSLSFEDVELLGMAVQSSWKGDEIAAQIEEIRSRGYRIVYSCTDGASNLKNALNTSNLERVSDCSHVFSKLLEKAYKNDPIFTGFMKSCALLNRQNYMGQDAGICPPKQRSKARFLNLKPIYKWAQNSLGLLDNLQGTKRNEQQNRIYEKLQWLTEYQDLIKELGVIVGLTENISKILKLNGMSEKGNLQIKELLDQTEQVPAFFKEGALFYISQNEDLLSKYERFICSSDIIESYFGKFKNQQAKNPDKGITINSLRITHYDKKIDKVALKNGLEKVRMKDLNTWKIKNGLKSFASKKKELHQKMG